MRRRPLVDERALAAAPRPLCPPPPPRLPVRLRPRSGSRSLDVHRSSRWLFHRFTARVSGRPRHCPRCADHAAAAGTNVQFDSETSVRGAQDLLSYGGHLVGPSVVRKAHSAAQRLLRNSKSRPRWRPASARPARLLRWSPNSASTYAEV